MKKILSLFIVVSIIFTLFGCTERKITKELEESSVTAAETEKQESPAMTIDEFCAKAQGWWASAADGACYIVYISKDSWASGLYPGGFGPEGYVTNVVERSHNGTVSVTVHYPEQQIYEDIEPAQDSTFTLKSTDDFQNKLSISSDGKWVDYVYAGPDDYQSKCEELLYNDSTGDSETPQSESDGALKYIGAPAKVVFDDFGYNFTTYPYSGGMSFSYGYGMNFKFSNAPYDRNRVPSDEAIITEIMVEIKGTEVYKGAKIGDSIEQINQKLGIDYYENTYEARTIVGGYTIRWIIDPADMVVIAAFVS